MRLRYLNRRGLRLLTEPWYRYGTTPFTSVLAERQQALIRRIGWVFRFGIRTVLAEAGVAASNPRWFIRPRCRRRAPDSSQDAVTARFDAAGGRQKDRQRHTAVALLREAG